eukprot:3758088-Alexandrium_andersonii.AAC.1
MAQERKRRARAPGVRGAAAPFSARAARASCASTPRRRALGPSRRCLLAGQARGAQRRRAR